MDTTKQAALEALVGRGLTTDEIAKAESRMDQDLSILLSAGLTKLEIEVRDELGVMRADALGPEDGAAFLDALDAFVAAGKDSASEALQPYYSAIKRASKWIYMTGLDLADTGVREILDALAQEAIVSQASVDKLKNLAEKSISISVSRVSEVLNS